ncbi:MAG: hypothetical protein HY528_04635 [Chloroflexi bacterium]|nr:hypothetical protein [Chloroflexota bacterium]
MKVKTRKATMTNKERIEALLRREKPDRVPHWPAQNQNFVAVYSGGGSVADQYTRDPKKWYQAEKKASQDFDWVFTPSFNGRRGLGGAFGGVSKLPTNKYSQAAYVVKFAADTAEEVMALKKPDVKKIADIASLKAFYKLTSQEELENKPFNLSIGGLGITNTAAGIAGYDNLCKWMIQKPEIAHRLLRLATDYNIEQTQYYRDIFGVDRVLPTGANAASSNQLISPKHFEQFALPYLKEAHQKVLAMGFKHICQHICGDHNLNLPYWQQIPMGDPGIVSVANEIDLETAAKYFPKDIIEGNLDTTIIQNGTPEEVYQAARKVIEQGKSLANGFILRPACQIPPYASVENIMAITRALNDFGWYD